jgi:hypothetical protein
MKTKNFSSLIASTGILLTFIFTSCSKPEISQTGGPLATGSLSKELSVIISDAPADFQQVYIDIQKVEIKELSDESLLPGNPILSSDTDEEDRGTIADDFGTWKTISFSPQNLNLLALRNGRERILGSVMVNNAVSKIRITLGAESYAIDKQGNQRPLLMNPANESVFYIQLSENDLDENLLSGKHEIRIDFDLVKSVVENNGILGLEPHIRPFSISGFGILEGIVGTQNGSPAIVTITDENGVVATTITEEDGYFQLRGIRPGIPCRVIYDAPGHLPHSVDQVVPVKGQTTALENVMLNQ